MSAYFNIVCLLRVVVLSCHRLLSGIPLSLMLDAMLRYDGSQQVIYQLCYLPNKGQLGG
ncbi:MAG: hypothetical protein ABL860_02725 [Candidatus Nitrotoga sp.]